jgi:hypothetical protein
MDIILATAAQYDDLVLEVFFESSESDDDDERVAERVSAMDTGAAIPVTEMDIESDLEKLESALVQQPFRTTTDLGLQKMVRAGDDASDEWKRIVAHGVELDARVDRSIVDILSPALVGNLCENWPARQKWSSQQELCKHYPSLRVVATRLGIVVMEWRLC